MIRLICIYRSLYWSAYTGRLPFLLQYDSTLLNYLRRLRRYTHDDDDDYSLDARARGAFPPARPPTTPAAPRHHASLRLYSDAFTTMRFLAMDIHAFH